ncbi:MAG TPA: glucose 1-dehydrogenase [Steroidobacteraceae bacterium]|jgi:3-oxoacyl-[acyl-carrier protein] reductase|nr:glucose 1-dehydrogenase [Steroidobacteraceae bacterium]
MSTLTGRVAIVTGASKGIGAQIARALAAAGAAVVVNYAGSRAGAENVVSEIKQAGGNAIAVQADVAKAQDVQRLVAQTVKAFGAPDILVNNAGVYEFAPLEALTAELFHRQFDINVLGLLQVTQEAAKHFSPKGGSIINISSVVSQLSLPGSSVYAATKAAVDTITRVLAKELGGRRIRVNSINPGVIETEGTHTQGIIGSDFEKNVVAQTPLGRVGQPDDVAKVAVFLASEDSGWISGETILTAGGLR